MEQAQQQIKVAVRVRPISIQQSKLGLFQAFKIEKKSVQLQPELFEDISQFKKIYSLQKSSYQFDQSFNQYSTNQQLFDKIVKNMIDSAYKAYNGTIIMYGQTGSGKTFTMLGEDFQNSTLTLLKDLEFRQNKKIQEENNCNQGILVLALKQIFRQKQFRQGQFNLLFSYLQIYNDQVYDLFQSKDQLSHTLKICQDIGKKQFYVKGVKEESATTLQEVMQLLKKGQDNRHIASTIMNHNSSRSHAIFRVLINGVIKQKSKSGRFKAILVFLLQQNFVDLAGSEKMLKKVKVKAERENQSKHINKSLFFLTQVISLLSQKKESDMHIPFRNSPLTKILKNSISGNAKTTIILCLHPCNSELQNSLMTIRFGLNAKNIGNRIESNFQTIEDEQELRKKVVFYQVMIKNLKKSHQRELEQMKKRMEEKGSLKMLTQPDQSKQGINQSNIFEQKVISNLIHQNELLQKKIGILNQLVTNEANSYRKGTETKELYKEKYEQMLKQNSFFKQVVSILTGQNTDYLQNQDIQFINRLEKNTENFLHKIKMYKNIRALKENIVSQNYQIIQKQIRYWRYRINNETQITIHLKDFINRFKHHQLCTFQSCLNQSRILQQIDQVQNCKK